MKKEYVITRQGKDFVLYEGLLDEAHQQGLSRISTTLIQIPAADNGNRAIVQAEVETGKGTFSGIGDASPDNVKAMVAPHVIRMAETRAKARALRDAVNVGETSVDELGEASVDELGADDREAEASEAQQAEAVRLLKATSGKAPANGYRMKVSEAAAIIAKLGPQVERANGKREESPESPPSPSIDFKPASANQLATITKLSTLMGEPERPDSESMSSAQASERITELSRAYNEKRGVRA